MKRRYGRFTVAFSVALLACGLFGPDETKPATVSHLRSWNGSDFANAP